MGMRVLHVAADLIEVLLTHGTQCAKPQNAPADLEVLDVRFDVVKRQIDLVLRSSLWDELPLRPDPSGKPNGWLGDRLEPVVLTFERFL